MNINSFLKSCLGDHFEASCLKNVCVVISFCCQRCDLCVHQSPLRSRPPLSCPVSGQDTDLTSFKQTQVDSTQAYTRLRCFFLPPHPRFFPLTWRGESFLLSTHKNTIHSQLFEPTQVQFKGIYGRWKRDNTFSSFLSPEGLSWEAIIYTAFVKINSQNRNQSCPIQDGDQLNNTSLTGSPSPCPSLLQPRSGHLNKTQVLLPANPGQGRMSLQSLLYLYKRKKVEIKD